MVLLLLLPRREPRPGRPASVDRAFWSSVVATGLRAIVLVDTLRTVPDRHVHGNRTTDLILAVVITVVFTVGFTAVTLLLSVRMRQGQPAVRWVLLALTVASAGIVSTAPVWLLLAVAITSVASVVFSFTRASNAFFARERPGEPPVHAGPG